MINNNNICPGCDKHCASDELRCGKGRMIFELENTSEMVKHEHFEHRSHEGGEWEHHGHGGRCHGPEMHHDEFHKHHHHGKHGKHDVKPWWEENGGNELYGMLGKCGHFLFKRPGAGRGQQRILQILSERKNMTQRELQDILDIKPGSLSEILSKLEGRGLIAREKSEEDKRRATVSITEAGEKAFGEKTDERANEDLFSALSEEEQENLRQLLSKLINAWYPKD